MMKSAILIALTAIPFASHAQKSACDFSVANESFEVGWTAYKTTQKAAVPGAFKIRELKGPTQANSLKKLMEGLTATVDIASSDTKNPERDKTLQEKFFGLLKPGPVSGKFRHVSEKDMKGDLVITLNGRQQSLPFTYAFNETTGEITAESTLDILKFNASTAFQSLHEACAKLHTGSDGVSKTWSEVTVHLKAKVAKTCK